MFRIGQGQDREYINYHRAHREHREGLYLHIRLLSVGSVVVYVLSILPLPYPEHPDIGCQEIR